MSRLRPFPITAPVPLAWSASRVIQRAWHGLLLVMVVVGGAAAEAPAVVGLRLDTLVAGGRTYRDVEVRSVGERTIVFLHDGGLASVALRELAPDLQERFGYSAEGERAAEARSRAGREAVEARLARQREARTRRHEAALATSFEALLQRFGQPAARATEVDLRPKFFERTLGIKDQGRRPSCAVFAIVSALEFQNAALSGLSEKLSEEYLIWASRKVTRRLPGLADAAAGAEGDEADEGFALPEVVAALRAYGIPLQASMPNTFGSRMAAIRDPPPEVIQEARARRRVSIHVLTGRDAATQVNNIVHALNAEVPVVIGLRWPHYRTLRAGYLSEQKPIQGYAHAVTLVGYESPGGRLEDTVFHFKNSYGVRWGQGGYGRVTYRYLQEHLLHAILLEVQRGAAG